LQTFQWIYNRVEGTPKQEIKNEQESHIIFDIDPTLFSQRQAAGEIVEGVVKEIDTPFNTVSILKPRPTTEKEEEEDNNAMDRTG